MGQKETILVTGGCGYIGSHIAHLLQDSGARIVVVDNLSNSHPFNIPQSAIFVEADVLDTKRMRTILQEHDVACVIHMAAFLSVEESMRAPDKYYRNNVEGTANLLQACGDAKVRKFIFSSTAATYASSAEKLREDSVAEPLSPYGLGKLKAEQLVRDACAKHAMRGVILRYFNVAGADPQGRTGQIGTHASHLIARACQVAAGDAEKMFVFGNDYPTKDGTCIRDYIHVTDLAAAHLAVLEKEFDVPVALFNCGYGQGFSVREVLETFQRVTGITLPMETAPRREGDSAQTIADNSALLKATKWRPQHDKLETLIGTAWDWYQRERLRT